MPGTDFSEGSRGVVQVVVTPSGSMAWMIEGLFSNPTAKMAEILPGRAVYALLAGDKRPQLLAYSESIVSLSLAAAPGHIYWLEASGPRTLPAP